jgi:hypothetical protein
MYDLMTGIASAFDRPADAERLLQAIRFPRERRPNFEQGMAQAWNDVFADLESGVLPPAPYRTILRAALRVFAGQRLLQPLAVQYGLVEAGPPQVVPEPLPETPGRPGVVPAQAPPATCHVIIRAGTEEEQQYAEQRLRSLGLQPQAVWSTGTAISYRISSDDHSAVRRTLVGTDLGWTVVAAGEPDYLLQELFVEGPDQRRFRVRDAPAQQTISNLGTEILNDQYPRSGDATVPITVDHVDESGKTQRVDAESTLHDAGVRDGDTLRVGYQTNAGSVHPDEHENALYRARNQLRAFARSHPGFHVRANSTRLPTDYELRFRRRSLGPPPWDGADPVEIDEHDDHVVLVVLGPEFPRQAPALWWETPIFHPNVAPNYGDGLRAPQLAGKVCLGVLADEWQPGRDFGELCRMVLDMAAFRSYGIFRETGRFEADGVTPLVAGDFYDKAAAQWVWHNQKRIKEMGGQVKTARPQPEVEYPNLIEPVP